MIIENLEIQIKGKLLKLAEIEAEDFRDIEDPEKIISILKNQKKRPDIFTFAQKPPDFEPKYNYSYEWDNFAAITISSYEDWWNQSKLKETRKKIRRGIKKGIIIKTEKFGDKIAEGLKRIWDESPMRQGKKFWHYKKDVETVKKEVGTFKENSDFICVYLGDELVGLIKLIYLKQCALTMQVISFIKYRKKYINNIMLAKAVELCVKKKIKYFIYGKYLYGNKGEDSFALFKKSNGFEKVDIPRYFIPMTLKGKIAYSLNLHKGIVELLPRPLIDILRNFRNKFLKLKYSDEM